MCGFGGCGFGCGAGWGPGWGAGWGAGWGPGFGSCSRFSNWGPCFNPWRPGFGGFNTGWFW